MQGHQKRDSKVVLEWEEVGYVHNYMNLLYFYLCLPDDMLWSHVQGPRKGFPENSEGVCAALLLKEDVVKGITDFHDSQVPWQGLHSQFHSI